MMEKMFINLEGLDFGAGDGFAFNEVPRVQTGEGIVSYQSKMYQTVLDQGNASRRNRQISSTSAGLREIRLWGPARLTSLKTVQK
jgi:hypothetical protein